CAPICSPLYPQPPTSLPTASLALSDPSRHCLPPPPSFFFFNDTATTEIYTLSLHDALPISEGRFDRSLIPVRNLDGSVALDHERSEEHTSELQSRSDLVCRLLLEKKNIKIPHSSDEVERAEPLRLSGPDTRVTVHVTVTQTE